MSLQSRRATHVQDPGAAFLDRWAALWQRYGRTATIAAGVAAAVSAVAFFSMRSRAQSEDQASEKLAEGSALFLQSNYQQSLQAAKQVYESFAGTPSALDAHRLAGDDQYWIGDFKSAIAEYRRYLDKVKSGVLADAAQRSLANALEMDKQYLEAASTYESLVGKFDRESSAEFLTGAARCYRLVNQPARQKAAIRRLVDEFGDTSVAYRARIELGELNASR